MQPTYPGPAPLLPERAPVVVIGAGYAGLSAALMLHDENVSALVIEAADRIGGRIWSESRAAVVDHGGQWVGATQHHLHGLADRFDCETFPTWYAGDHLELWHDGARRRYTGAGPEEAPGMDEYLQTADRLDELATRIRLDDPASTPELEEWDSETVHSFFRRTVTSPDSRRRLALAVQGVWSTEPRDLSLFHLLFYIASAGGFEQLMETEGCAQERRFVAGAQAPALAVAAHLGDRVHLGTTVREVRDDGDEVSVHTSNGTVRTQRVVVATPPDATTRIRFAPALPVARSRWIHRSPMGDVAKVHVFYDRPFWRNDGLSGVATLYGDEPVGVVFDNSPADGSVGVLVAFVYGDRLRRWSAQDAAARRAAVVATLSTLFGPQAEDVIDYTEKIWPEDPYAGGGYVANPTPGTWYEHGAAGWRTPSGPIHWAGAETAGTWNGYMDGAISSGERAATEVLAALRGSSDEQAPAAPS